MYPLAQVFTGYPQHRDLRDREIEKRITRGVLPARPTTAECKGVDMPTVWWEIVLHCLSFLAQDRPSARDLLRIIYISGSTSRLPEVPPYVTGSAVPGQVLMHVRAVVDRKCTALVHCSL
jgi:hypothetical protein